MTSFVSEAKEKKNSNKTFTMIARQALAYCIQEVSFDPATETFSIPANCKKVNKEQKQPEADSTSASAENGNA